MEPERYIKESFVVIGKEGSTNDVPRSRRVQFSIGY